MYEVFLPLMAAVLLGFALGLEREITNKYAGLRTHILVCLGACVFTIISIYGFPTVLSGDNANGLRDTARVAAQVVTGIGFIGAGTVLRHGSSVSGLTTAATLWMAASIGMACGSQQYVVAVVATLFSVLVLILIKFFERRVLTKRKITTKLLKISLVCPNDISEAVYEYITNKFIYLNEISKKYCEDNDAFTKIEAGIKVRDINPISSLHKDFQQFYSLKSISIRETDEL